jgi:hypothetical protein
MRINWMFDDCVYYTDQSENAMNRSIWTSWLVMVHGNENRGRIEKIRGKPVNKRQSSVSSSDISPHLNFSRGPVKSYRTLFKCQWLRAPKVYSLPPATQTLPDSLLFLSFPSHSLYLFPLPSFVFVFCVALALCHSLQGNSKRESLL